MGPIALGVPEGGLALAVEGTSTAACVASVASTPGTIEPPAPSHAAASVSAAPSTQVPLPSAACTLSFSNLRDKRCECTRAGNRLPTDEERESLIIVDGTTWTLQATTSSPSATPDVLAGLRDPGPDLLHWHIFSEPAQRALSQFRRWVQRVSKKKTGSNDCFAWHTVWSALAEHLHQAEAKLPRMFEGVGLGSPHRHFRVNQTNQPHDGQSNARYKPHRQTEYARHVLDMTLRSWPELQQLLDVLTISAPLSSPFILPGEPPNAFALRASAQVTPAFTQQYLEGVALLLFSYFLEFIVIHQRPASMIICPMAAVVRTARAILEHQFTKEGDRLRKHLDGCLDKSDKKVAWKPECSQLAPHPGHELPARVVAQGLHMGSFQFAIGGHFATVVKLPTGTKCRLRRVGRGHRLVCEQLATLAQETPAETKTTQEPSSFGSGRPPGSPPEPRQRARPREEDARTPRGPADAAAASSAGEPHPIVPPVRREPRACPAPSTSPPWTSACRGGARMRRNAEPSVSSAPSTVLCCDHPHAVIQRAYPRSL